MMKNKDMSVIFRLDSKLVQQFDKKAKRFKVSRSELIRRLMRGMVASDGGPELETYVAEVVDFERFKGEFSRQLEK
jgi:metal-responsive CopG/Arc/MetJ family transcriptional regulator